MSISNLLSSNSFELKAKSLTSQKVLVTESNITETNQLATKAYVDAASAGVGDLKTVLQAGDDANGESITGLDNLTVTEIDSGVIKLGPNSVASVQCYTSGAIDMYMGLTNGNPETDAQAYRMNANIGGGADFGLNLDGKNGQGTFETIVSINSAQHGGGIGLDMLEHPISNSGKITIDDSTDSTTTTTGSLITAGGMGIAKSLNVGGTMTVADDLIVNGDANIGGDMDIVGDVTASKFIGGSSNSTVALSTGTTVDNVLLADVGPGFSRSYLTQSSGTYNLTVNIPNTVIDEGGELTFVFNKWTLTASTFNVIISCNNNVFRQAGKAVNQLYGTAFDGGLTLSNRYTVVKVICNDGEAYAYIANQTD